MKKLLAAIFIALCFHAGAQMLPVDTAVVVIVGPLIDDTDFKSMETAIAYNAAGMSVDLIKSSGTSSNKTDLTLTTASTQDWTALGNGMYEVEITAAQNDTEGNLQVVGVCTGVLPFFSPVYTVVPVAVYNSLTLGTDNLQVDTVQVEGSDATDQINAADDTALADYDAPTNAEMVARTLPTASYFDATTDTVTTDSASRIASQADVSSLATAASIAALNNISTAQVNAEVDTALADYDAPTNAEMVARTLAAASYATASAQATAQADLDIVTGVDGTTLATLQPNYAPATAASVAALNNISAAEVNAEVDTALADYDAPTNAEMNARTLASASYATSSAQVTAQADLDVMAGADGATLATLQPNYAPSTASALSTVGTNVSTLVTRIPDTVSLANINAEADTALSDIFLDKLFAADYDPASKPGVSTALLNELIESNGGVSRYTAGALAQAPGGGSGGDASEANQLTIMDWIQGIMSKDHTLSTAVGTFDPTTDSLEAVSTAVAGITGVAGDTEVTSDTGGAGALAYKTSGGAGIGGAKVTAYPTSEYSVGTYSAVTSTTTRDDGSWGPIYLNSGIQYTLVFRKTGPNPYGPNTATVTP